MTETNDWGSTTATAGAMEVGGIAIGSLDPVGETDWLAIDFEAGTTYEVFIASPTGDIFLDPVFVLYDASGTLVQIFDDGYGPDVAGEVTIGTSGTYYISVESWGNQGGGDYQMTVTEQGPVVLTEYSIQEIADQLTLGYWGTSRRAWNTSGDDLVAGDQDGDVDGTNDNIITFNVSAISSGYQDYARTSFELWAAIADIEFVETTGAADITFQDTDLGSAYASSSTSYISPGVREITSTTINVGSDWEGFAGSAYTLQTFIHEIGHALGLGHGGNYNGNATYNVDGTGDNEYLNDSWQATIMSYFSQSEATAVNASYAFLLTPMLADIQAVIDLYGAATDTRLGDTVYGFNNNTGDFFDLDGLSPNANYNYALTLVDHGGNDTIDLSGSSRGVVLSLEAGVASSIMGETANLFIVPGSVIENAIGTSDNDTITGNSANNTINGMGGTNTLNGGAGSDTFIGGNGIDTFFGGSGFDTVDYSSSTAAVTVDLTNGGLGSGGYADGDVYYNISRVFGSDFNDTFSGGGYFYGGAGFDTFIGGVMKGVYIGGSGFDTVDYSSSTAAVTVDLTNGGLGSGGYADGDVYYNISRVF
ncbi:MAG: M10 family metallopeptidase C-terminal domain-containing protein, partial [Pseudomonadota bacterium]